MRTPRHISSPSCLRAQALGPRAAVLLLAAIFLSGCAPRSLALEGAPHAHYQTAFPLHDTSHELEHAFRSLHRVVYTGEYHTFVFPPEAGVTEGDLTDPATLGRAVEDFFETESRRGTAAVLARTGTRIALITNDHVVRFPAVRVHHFDEEPGTPRAARRVASVSLLTREWGGLFDHPTVGVFEVLARDQPADLALLEVRLPDLDAADGFPPIEVTAGDPRRLSWGSFVYVLGFPSGFPLVTRAIVSDPDHDGRGGFLTDGLWNEGISGGPILAIRGGTGRLEWVGMTRAGAGAWEVRLQPRGDEEIEDDLGLLYRGPIYAERVLRIQYGITHSVPMTAIRDFLARNRDLLRRRGYDLRRF
jgi:hypothetical protein